MKRFMSIVLGLILLMVIPYGARSQHGLNEEDAKEILKALYKADQCDSLLLYYELELGNQQMIIQTLDSSNKEWRLISEDQNKIISNKDQQIKLQKKRNRRTKFSGLVGIVVAFLIGLAL